MGYDLKSFLRPLSARSWLAIAAIAGTVSFSAGLFESSANAQRGGQNVQALGAIRLAPHTIIDRRGFGRPLEAYHVLVPSGWRVESDVFWGNPMTGPCAAREGAPVMRLTSPDGRRSFEMAPGHFLTQETADLNWSVIPPMMQPAMRNYPAELQHADAQKADTFRRMGGSCHVGRAADALDAARRYVAPALRPNARIVDARPIPTLQQAVAAHRAEATRGVAQQMAAQGLRFQTFTDAVSVRLALTDANGRPIEERLEFGLSGAATSFEIPGLSANNYPIAFGVRTTTELQTTPVVVMRAPQGELDEMESIARAIMASMRAHPGHRAAMELYEAEMARIVNRGAADRAEILNAAYNSVSDMQMRGWRQRQGVQDRGQAALVDAARGVDRRIDPISGVEVHLPDTGAGFYANGRGEYLVMTRPGFTPAELFPGETWREMAPATP